MTADMNSGSGNDAAGNACCIEFQADRDVIADTHRTPGQQKGGLHADHFSCHGQRPDLCCAENLRRRYLPWTGASLHISRPRSQGG